MNPIISSVTEISEHFFENLQQRRSFAGVLMCPPDYFKVIDVKNPHMKAHVGHTNIDQAQMQWKNLKASFESREMKVYAFNPIDGLEDMVFTANPAFIGDDKQDKSVALLSNMRHPSRKKEVPAYAEWFKGQNYQIKTLSSEAMLFEGHGDALWHANRKLIFGGYGYRTEKKVYQEISELFACPVITLKLLQEDFYHLDTCLCILSDQTALYYPGAFTSDGVALIQHCFSDAIEINENEARKGFACNAWGFKNTVFIQKNNPLTVAALQKRDFQVVEVETEEFMKSGGSVFCMKTEVF